MNVCRHCKTRIEPHASTFEIPANHDHGELVFCSLGCVDDYYTQRHDGAVKS